MLKQPKRSATFLRTFRWSALWTTIGTYLPGLGLVKGGLRRTGLIALGVFAALSIGIVLWAVIDPGSLISLGVNPAALKTLVVVLPLVTLAWAGIIVVTQLVLRPRILTPVQRGLAALLVGVLTFTIAAPMAVATRYTFDQARLLNTIFRAGGDIRSGTAPNLDARDPWKNKSRVNILLLGGDAGADRTGTRTDTVILASIDTKTGDTLLISLPRNTARMPFPESSPLHEFYPDGFTNGDGSDLEYMLTELYENVPRNIPPEVLGPTDNLGADALKLAVGEATGLPVDFYVLVQIEGFHKLIDALGGITVNVNTWVAIGGDTSRGIKPTAALAPGPHQHLTGAEALWYARGRYGADDYQRMDRQRCVIDAVIQQANPANVLTRYEDVARQSKEIVQTDMPQEILPAVVDLSLRVKDGKTKSIVFKNGEDGFQSGNPDFALMRERIAAAIAPPPPPADPAPAPEPVPAETADPGSEAPEPEQPSSAPDEDQPAEPIPVPTPAEDLSDSCAFNPALAAEQGPKPPWE